MACLMCQIYTKDEHFCTAFYVHTFLFLKLFTMILKISVIKPPLLNSNFGIAGYK